MTTMIDVKPTGSMWEVIYGQKSIIVVSNKGFALRYAAEVQRRVEQGELCFFCADDLDDTAMSMQGQSTKLRCCSVACLGAHMPQDA